MANAYDNAYNLAAEFVDDADVFDNPLDDIDPDLNLLSHVQSKCYYHSPSNLSLLLPSRDSFSLFHCNVRSAPRNMDALSYLLSELNHNFSIIGISETWLSNYNSALYSFPHYKAFYTCRQDQRGGGVALYVSEALTAVSRADLYFCDESCESAFVEVTCTGQLCIKNASDTLIIGVMYRPPNSDMNGFMSVIQDILHLIEIEKKTAFIMGDFNIHMNCYDSDTNAQRFLDLMHSNTFLPLFDKPTRVTTNTSYTIDNIFTNLISDSIHNIILYTDVTDHFPIFTLIPLLIKEGTRNRKQFRSFSERNRLRFISELENETWASTLANNQVECALSAFLGAFCAKFEECFPMQTRSQRVKAAVKKPWVNRELRILLRKKNRAFVNFRRRPTLFNEIRYRALKTATRRRLRAAERDYYHALIDDSKQNSRRTWQILYEVIGRPGQASLNK